MLRFNLFLSFFPSNKNMSFLQKKNEIEIGGQLDHRRLLYFILKTNYSKVE